MIHEFASRVGLDALTGANPAALSASHVVIAAVAAAAILCVAADLARACRRFLARLIILGAAAAGIALVAALPLLRQAERPLSPEELARAEIEQTLADVVDAVAANDLERALAYVSPGAPQTRAILERNRHSVKIADAAMTNLRVGKIDLDVYPPAAFVSFHASVNGTATAWPTPIRLPYRVELDFEDVMLRREADGVWRVSDYYAILPPGASADDVKPVDNKSFLPYLGLDATPRNAGELHLRSATSEEAKRGKAGESQPGGAGVTSIVTIANAPRSDGGAVSREGGTRIATDDARPSYAGHGNHDVLTHSNPNSVLNGLGFTLEPPAMHDRRAPRRSDDEIDFGFDDDPTTAGAAATVKTPLSDVETLEADLESNLPSPPVRRGE